MVLQTVQHFNISTFQSAGKEVFNASKEFMKKNHFNQKQTTPRILAGLKSGQLLAKKMEPKDLLELNLEQPIFSPDLMLWKTSLNDHFLPTRSIGVNSDLVEKESDFPRFQLLCPMAETDEDLLKR